MSILTLVLSVSAVYSQNTSYTDKTIKLNTGNYQFEIPIVKEHGEELPFETEYIFNVIQESGGKQAAVLNFINNIEYNERPEQYPSFIVNSRLPKCYLHQAI